MEIKNIEPYFTVQFVNIDSLTKLTARSKEIDASTKLNDDRLKEIKTLEGDFADEIDSLTKKNQELALEKKKINLTLVEINRRLVRLDEVSSPGARTVLLFDTDSLSSFKFLLNTHDDQSVYTIKLGEKVFSIRATYTRDTVLEDRSLRIVAQQLQIEKNFYPATDQLDSIKLNCGDTLICKSDEATAILYF